MERSIHMNTDGSAVLTEDERVLELPPGADVAAEAKAFFTPEQPE